MTDTANSGLKPTTSSTPTPRQTIHESWVNYVGNVTYDLTRSGVDFFLEGVLKELSVYAKTTSDTNDTTLDKFKGLVGTFTGFTRPKTLAMSDMIGSATSYVAKKSLGNLIGQFYSAAKAQEYKLDIKNRGWINNAVTAFARNNVKYMILGALTVAGIAQPLLPIAPEFLITRFGATLASLLTGAGLGLTGNQLLPTIYQFVVSKLPTKKLGQLKPEETPTVIPETKSAVSDQLKPEEKIIAPSSTVVPEIKSALSDQPKPEVKITEPTPTVIPETKSVLSDEAKPEQEVKEPTFTVVPQTKSVLSEEPKLKETPIIIPETKSVLSDEPKPQQETKEPTPTTIRLKAKPVLRHESRVEQPKEKEQPQKNIPMPVLKIKPIEKKTIKKSKDFISLPSSDSDSMSDEPEGTRQQAYTPALIKAPVYSSSQDSENSSSMSSSDDEQLERGRSRSASQSSSASSSSSSSSPSPVRFVRHVPQNNQRGRGRGNARGRRIL